MKNRRWKTISRGQTSFDCIVAAHNTDASALQSKNVRLLAEIAELKAENALMYAALYEAQGVWSDSSHLLAWQAIHAILAKRNWSAPTPEAEAALAALEDGGHVG